jgi:hypothetical protein
LAGKLNDFSIIPVLPQQSSSSELAYIVGAEMPFFIR